MPAWQVLEVRSQQSLCLVYAGYERLVDHWEIQCQVGIETVVGVLAVLWVG